MTILLLMILNVVALIYFIKRKSWRITLGLCLLLGFLVFFTNIIKIPLTIAAGVAVVFGIIWMKRFIQKSRSDNKKTAK